LKCPERRDFMSETKTTYRGRCFCGAVELTVTGAPEAMGYCHCTSCRTWSAGPVNAFTLWKPEAVKVTKGADLVGTFHKTDNSFRKWCRACGGHLMNQHPVWGLIDVYAATIPDFPFKPALHVNYQETVLPMHDDLPKFRDIPKELGGTAELLAA
jgi:hypothetical protein